MTPACLRTVRPCSLPELNPVVENGRMLGFGQLPLADVVRQAIYSRLARYEDVNDAERLFPGKDR
jgi:hypothetical protein